jgi:hypothetical protein
MLTLPRAGEDVRDSVEVPQCAERYRIVEEQRDESDSRIEHDAKPSERDDNRDRQRR